MWYNVKIEYIGGQNKALVVTCNEKFFHRSSVAIMIESCVPFPRIARIDNSLVASIANELSGDENIEIVVNYNSEKASKTVKNVSAISLSTFHSKKNEASSKNAPSSYYMCR